MKDLLEYFLKMSYLSERLVWTPYLRGLYNRDREINQQITDLKDECEKIKQLICYYNNDCFNKIIYNSHIYGSLCDIERIMYDYIFWKTKMLDWEIRDNVKRMKLDLNNALDYLESYCNRIGIYVSKDINVISTLYKNINREIQSLYEFILCVRSTIQDNQMEKLDLSFDSNLVFNWALQSKLEDPIFDKIGRLTRLRNELRKVLDIQQCIDQQYQLYAKLKSKDSIFVYRNSPFVYNYFHKAYLLYVELIPQLNEVLRTRLSEDCPLLFTVLSYDDFTRYSNNTWTVRSKPNFTKFIFNSIERKIKIYREKECEHIEELKKQIKLLEQESIRFHTEQKPQFDKIKRLRRRDARIEAFNEAQRMRERQWEESQRNREIREKKIKEGEDMLDSLIHFGKLGKHQ